jgi:hypothetical protein
MDGVRLQKGNRRTLTMELKTTVRVLLFVRLISLEVSALFKSCTNLFLLFAGEGLIVPNPVR